MACWSCSQMVCVNVTVSASSLENVLNTAVMTSISLLLKVIGPLAAVVGNQGHRCGGSPTSRGIGLWLVVDFLPRGNNAVDPAPRMFHFFPCHEQILVAVNRFEQ